MAALLKIPLLKLKFKGGVCISAHFTFMIFLDSLTRIVVTYGSILLQVLLSCIVFRLVL